MKAVIHCGMYSDTYNPGKKLLENVFPIMYSIDPMKQNYFQNNGFAKRNPFSSVQRWDQVFI